MNAAGPDCHPELLERCIRGELTTDEEQLLEQHLSNCTACRDRLERLAASPRRWSDAATWLREQLEADGNQPADSSGSAMEFRVSDFIVDELRPARTEGAIGRLDDVEVLEVVGQGAMGVVLKGYQPELQRLVALKVLRPELCTSGAARKRFLREARAAASVVHPHVMPIHAVRADGRLPYLVMPFLDCESLQHQLDREGPLELSDVLRIGVQVAQALDAAHAQGLVHRDVKPANILIERSGRRVLLADFGLARAVDDASLTNPGLVAGTPQYMSPEQARAERVDHRSDLFSLGSVLYALWTGHPPFRAENAVAVIRRLCDLEPRAMSDLRPETPDWLTRLVGRLQAKSPDHRPDSAAATVTLLEQALRHSQNPSAHSLPAELRSTVLRSQASAASDDVSSTLARFLSPPWLVGGLMMISIATIAAALAFLTPAPDTSSDVAVSRQQAVPLQPVTESPVSSEDVSLPDEDALPGNTLLAQAPESDAKYKTFDDAMRAGSAHLALKEISKSREPFEAALKLAPDDVTRVRIYRALLPAYRQESDWLLGAGALEFIITHSNQPAERSVARTELMSFLHARGKGDAAVARYEERLKVNPQDEGTLYILMEVFTRLEPNPQRAAVLLEQWRDLKQKSGEEMKVPEAAQLAGQYVKQKKFREGAELFEATAPRDPKLAAWHFKEAAAAWLKAGDVERALAAANASAESQPESRGDLLEHFWHRGLADVFFECGDFKQAIPHYEQAIAKTQIEGYLKDCQARLAEALEKVDQ